MAHAQDWLEALSELRVARRACAHVVVTDVKGSGPRDAGARMIVSLSTKTSRPEIVFGTIGGGNLEQLAMEHCGVLLGRSSASAETVAYPLSEKVGQCCGGEVRLFFETYLWKRRRVAIFGAGHVAQALGGLAPYLSADVVLIDGREEAEIHPPLAKSRPFEMLLVDNPEAEVDTLPDDALVLVMTHNHALDLEIVAKALRRPFPYLGLIGSERKWERFQKRLAQRGFSESDIVRVRCPIGVSKHSKEPNAIALSAAAELSELLSNVEPRTEAP